MIHTEHRRLTCASIVLAACAAWAGPTSEPVPFVWDDVDGFRDPSEFLPPLSEPGVHGLTRNGMFVVTGGVEAGGQISQSQ